MRTTFALLASLSFSLLLGSCTAGGRGGGGPGQCPIGCTACNMGVCNDCKPGTNACQNDAVFSCNSDGTIGAQIKACDTSNFQTCMGGDCLSPCDVAGQSHSYIGCDYWPVTLLNAQLSPEFDFAVAVANPLTVGDVTQSAPATVTITRGGQNITTVMVMPGDVQTIKLPWVMELSQNNGMFGMEASNQVTAGAYHLTSNLPVTVYQFNPLEFEKNATPTCQDQAPIDPTKCHSYTNDASILLPTPVLGMDYTAISRQTFTVDAGGGPSSLPGFVTIVGTEDGTNVTITSTAYTDASNGVPAMTPGSTAMFQLDAGTVLQVITRKDTSPCKNTDNDGLATYCDLGPDHDLTGSQITSDKPIAVFGGHDCTFVPYNKWACDHIEEQLTPVSTWGQKIAVVETTPQTTGEPNVWRVVSGSDGNTITFDPASVNPSVTLDAGKYVEFTAQGGFYAVGTGRIAIAQYMVGENAIDMNTTVGDPAMGLGVPVEQYRDNYDYLTPDTYTHSYVSVIAPTGTTIMLDGAPLGGTWSAIGGSGLSYVRDEVMPGAHHMTGSAKFGITVSGIANFTSYLYVGGLNLNDIPVQ